MSDTPQVTELATTNVLNRCDELPVRYSWIVDMEPDQTIEQSYCCYGPPDTSALKLQDPQYDNLVVTSVWVSVPDQGAALVEPNWAGFAVTIGFILLLASMVALLAVQNLALPLAGAMMRSLRWMKGKLGVCPTDGCWNDATRVGCCVECWVAWKKGDAP